MKKLIYLINPKSDFPTYYGAEVLESMGYKPGVQIANLALPTIASFIPKDFEVKLCDEQVSEVDFDIEADYIGITGYISQKNRMIEISKEFRNRGKIIIMGGPFVSLSPNVMREYCDILVEGEIENIADELFSDLTNNSFKNRYIGTKPDLTNLPLPRWDLYPNHRAAVGAIQTSKGCPYSCEFCDVIVYLGQKQRYKPIKNVIKELEQLYSLGYRIVFLSDDNFTINRMQAKKLLNELKNWNILHKSDPVFFRTQVSTDIVKDDELLKLCAEAGLNQVFIGIESPNSNSMKEVKKFQNVKCEMEEVIKKLLKFGILPQCGMMVGFDADDKDIFNKQFELAMNSFNPYFTLTLVVAPDSTPLIKRLKKEKRILDESEYSNRMLWESNIIHKTISKKDMKKGMQWLSSNLYAPENFANRFLNMLDILDCSFIPKGLKKNSLSNKDHIDRDILNISMKVKNMGKSEKKMFNLILEKIVEKNLGQDLFVTVMFFYAQLRYMYSERNLWEPKFIGLESPWSECKGLDK